MSIQISFERYECIKQIVVDMFIKYNIHCVPISGFEIAQKMGIKIIPYSTYDARILELLLKESEDGFSVEKDPGEYYIFYNDEKDYGRINHTIMHEIGHIVLGHTEDSEYAEKEVKFFAKYALAPPMLIHKLKLDNKYDIANIFNISLEAASYTLSYYYKWVEHIGNEYKNYEIAILNQFKDAC